MDPHLAALDEHKFSIALRTLGQKIETAQHYVARARDYVKTATNTDEFHKDFPPEAKTNLIKMEESLRRAEYIRATAMLVRAKHETTAMGTAKSHHKDRLIEAKAYAKRLGAKDTDGEAVTAAAGLGPDGSLFKTMNDYYLQVKDRDLKGKYKFKFDSINQCTSGYGHSQKTLREMDGTIYFSSFSADSLFSVDEFINTMNAEITKAGTPMTAQAAIVNLTPMLPVARERLNELNYHPKKGGQGKRIHPLRLAIKKAEKILGSFIPIKTA